MLSVNSNMHTSKRFKIYGVLRVTPELGIYQICSLENLARAIINIGPKDQSCFEFCEAEYPVI